MTDPHTPATAEAPPPPPLASMETLGAWTKEVQSKFMERYKAFLAAKPAPTRRAVLRILLQNTDASIGEVRRALNHAYRSTRLAGAIQAALTAHAAGDTQALANVRDPGTGTPTPYASADVASQHVRELNSASHLIRRDTPARLEKIAGSFPEIDAVLGDVVGTPEDAIARVAELEAEIVTMGEKLAEYKKQEGEE